MKSPAQRHFLRAVAALAAAAAAPAVQSHANGYELMLAQLIEHLRRLKQVQSIERKVELKRKLLADYADWTAGVLAGGAGTQDDVLVTVMMWHIDVGDLDAALSIAQYAIKHGLTMPDQYRRSLPCAVAEEVAEVVLKRLAAGEPVDSEQVERGALFDVLQLTDGHDMPDEVRAKLYKAIGYSYQSADRLEAALSALQRAVELHGKVGVKKDIERLEREIKNKAQPPAPGAA